MQDPTGNKALIRILVVEDDKAVLLMLKKILGMAGYTLVSSAETGKDAQAILAKNTFDLVFLDWWLPDMQGIDILKGLRASHDKLPIIMLTSESAKDRVVEALQAGASEYIIKPFSMDVIVQKMERALHRAKGK